MAEIAQLMQNGEQTFVDANGVPLDGGKVYMYIPTTTTFKDTWQDEGETILNTKPIVLDAAGRAIIYGNGKYRQVVKDQFGNLQWDQLTNWVDVATSVANALATTGTQYDLPVFIEGKPDAGEVFPIFTVARTSHLPAGLTGTVASIATPPTSTMTFTLLKNGVSIGTVTFAATTGAVTFTFVSQVSFSPGDKFSMTAPNPQDGNGAGISFTFVWTVG